MITGFSHAGQLTPYPKLRRAHSLEANTVNEPCNQVDDRLGILAGVRLRLYSLHCINVHLWWLALSLLVQRDTHICAHTSNYHHSLTHWCNHT